MFALTSNNHLVSLVRLFQVVRINDDLPYLAIIIIGKHFILRANKLIICWINAVPISLNNSMEFKFIGKKILFNEETVSRLSLKIVFEYPVRNRYKEFLLKVLAKRMKDLCHYQLLPTYHQIETRKEMILRKRIFIFYKKKSER